MSCIGEAGSARNSTRPRGTASAPGGERQGTVTGDLTLLGQTRPLTLAVTTPNVLITRPSLAANTVAELVDYAKKNPGKVSYCSSGTGSSDHLTGEVFKQIAGVSAVHVPYDPERDFVPISLYVKSPFIFVVNPSLPARNVSELVKLLRESKVPLSYSTPGAGLAQHLSMEFAKKRFGFDATHVPYRATGQSITDLAAGHVAAGFVEAGASIPLIKDGKLRALAVSASQRLPLLPDVPPFSEAAGAPDYEAVSWHILVAPAKTPQPIVEKVHNEMKRIMADPEMKAKVANIGLIPIDTPSVADMRTYIASENEKWGSLVKSLGLQGSQ